MSNKNKWIYNYFSEDEIKDIQSALDKVERNTVGEIVLSLRNKRTLLEKLYSQHELAWKDFNRLGVKNTKERTGIMIFIIFDEHYYDIIADEGIFAQIPDTAWNEMEETLKEEFKNSKYYNGIMALINKTGEVLIKKFPAKAGINNDNEIKDEIVLN
jgi:uncharacterized membrane protein